MASSAQQLMVSRTDDPGSRPEGSTAAVLAAASLELQQAQLDTDALYAAYLSGYEGWPFNGLTSLQISEISRYCAK
jgi:hypothetical protein